MIHYYKHISNKRFFQLKQRLVTLESNTAIPFCNENSFHLDREKFYKETLSINMYKTIEGLTEVIGLYFIDQLGDNMFTMYCTKYYDTQNRRYSKKHIVEQEKGIEFFEMNMKDLLESSLRKMESWSREDLDRITELSR